MDKRYYTEYYTLERGHWWFNIRALILEDFVRRKISKGKKLNILNVGVATGSTTEMLAKYGEVTSVEYDADCCTFLREELKMEVVNASIEALPFDNNTFDLVCAFDVIEHVDDDALAVAEMKRVCKAEGNVFITVPALMLLWNRHDEVNHHHRRYTKREVKALFANGEKGREFCRTYFNAILFLPVLVFRKLTQWFNKSTEIEHSGSDFGVLKNKPLNKLLAAIFSIEVYWLRFARFPIGVSFLYSWKKGR
jgi:SAM-dependent methyltransferase